MKRHKRAAVREAGTGLDYRALAEFRFQIRRFLHASEEAARVAGVEPQQHQLLLAVKGLGDETASVRALAERLQVQHHSAVELIDRAARQGLVRRVRDVRDRRQVRVELTQKGEKSLAALTVHHRKALGEAAALVEALDRLVSTLPQGDSPRSPTPKIRKQSSATQSSATQGVVPRLRPPRRTPLGMTTEQDDSSGG